MKKDYVYLSFIVILFVLLFAQSTSNQPTYSPDYPERNEIGRYQYFTDPEGLLQGFLDTKEGFVLMIVSGKSGTKDLREDFYSDILKSFNEQKEEIDRSSISDSLKKTLKEIEERRFEYKNNRIW